MKCTPDVLAEPVGGIGRRTLRFNHTGRIEGVSRAPLENFSPHRHVQVVCERKVVGKLADRIIVIRRAEIVRESTDVQRS